MDPQITPKWRCTHIQTWPLHTVLHLQLVFTTSRLCLKKSDQSPVTCCGCMVLALIRKGDPPLKTNTGSLWMSVSDLSGPLLLVLLWFDRWTISSGSEAAAVTASPFWLAVWMPFITVAEPRLAGLGDNTIIFSALYLQTRNLSTGTCYYTAQNYMFKLLT